MVFTGMVSWGQQWHGDLDAALKLAAAQGKAVLLYFSVPEACTTCEALEENIWKTPEFAAFAQHRLILAKPQFEGEIPFEEKAENLLIVEKYNKDGFFPHVILLDQNARVIGKVPQYENQDVGAYIRTLEALMRR
jgi:thioredoxin-related protein